MDVDHQAESFETRPEIGPETGHHAEPPLTPRSRGTRQRRARLAWAVGIVVALAIVIGAAGAFVHVSANETFDASASALDRATDAARDAVTALDATADDTTDMVAASEVIVASAADDLVDVAARTAFADAMTGLSASVQNGRQLLEDPIAVASMSKPFWTWELLDAARVLDERAEAAAERTEELDAARRVLDEGDELLVGAALPLFASVTPAAAALEAANVSARAVVLLDFREAGEAAAGQTRVGSGAASAFSNLAAAATNLKLSAESELAEKAGRLFDTRLEIEAFARSIAGGVVLDFDWAPIVAGVGGPYGMGGTATWAVVRGGFSTITLSHSVAENWPSADARALVAHEVGHAITSKCSTLFDSESLPANEEWATAWAISMGHTAVGNGVQAYGYPSQGMIDIAATCR